MSKRSGMAEELCWELRRAFQDLAAMADSELRPLGITAGDRALLEFLDRESEPISMSELARKTNVSRQHIQQTIQRLPNQKWILSTSDPKDQRAVLIALSKSGRDFWNRIRKIDTEFFKWLGPQLNRGEMKTALNVLQGLRKGLKQRVAKKGRK